MVHVESGKSLDTESGFQNRIPGALRAGSRPFCGVVTVGQAACPLIGFGASNILSQPEHIHPDLDPSLFLRAKLQATKCPLHPFPAACLPTNL